MTPHVRNAKPSVLTHGILRRLDALLASRTWAYLSAILTLIGLSSFVGDLEGWRQVFASLYKALFADRPWVVALVRGYEQIVDTYRAFVHPIFAFLFGWLHFRIPRFLYDWLFVLSISLSAWMRVFMSFLPAIFEKRRLAGQPPKAEDPYGVMIAGLPKQYELECLAEKGWMWIPVGIFTFPFEIMWDVVSGEADRRKRAMRLRKAELKAERATFRRRRKLELTEWRARWADILSLALRSAFRSTWRTAVLLGSLLGLDLLLRLLHVG